MNRKLRFWQLLAYLWNLNVVWKAKGINLLIQKRVLNDRGLQWENSVRQIPMHKEPICVFVQAFKAGAKNFKLNETASLCDVMVVTINDRCFHTKRTQMAEQCLFQKYVLLWPIYVFTKINIILENNRKRN